MCRRVKNYPGKSYRCVYLTSTHIQGKTATFKRCLLLIRLLNQLPLRVTAAHFTRCSSVFLFQIFSSLNFYTKSAFRGRDNMAVLFVWNSLFILDFFLSNLSVHSKNCYNVFFRDKKNCLEKNKLWKVKNLLKFWDKSQFSRKKLPKVWHFVTSESFFWQLSEINLNIYVHFFNKLFKISVFPVLFFVL